MGAALKTAGMRRCGRIARFSTFAALFMASCTPPLVLAHASSLTIVTLGFDDGTADQTLAAQELASHGMHGTFYIISGRVGQSGYLTQSQLLSFQNAGNEIGGHTITHPDLTSLSASQAQNEICGGRSALQGMGFTVTDFAYPFGAYNASVEKIVQNCGFVSGRAVGGIDCSGCATAEAIPPSDPYAVRTPDSIKSNTPLSAIESYVTQAENNGGGWVPLVLHHVCGGCDLYSVSQPTLDAFLTWLQGQVSNGGVAVETMAQVMGSGPSPSPVNVVQNPSLEQDTSGDGIPDCLQLAGYGTNTFTWTRTTDAHTGTYAEKLAIASISSGDRKLITAQHNSACEPAANVGHNDTFSVWYKSSQPIHLVAYYLTSGGWTWWAQSAQQPAESSWTNATWTTPTVPTGATALSAGVSLRAAGNVTMDDFSLSQN